jgi:RND superfamily putative drug exporter
VSGVFMPVVSHWAVRRPIIALISYFVVVIAIVGMGVGFGGSLNDSFDLPDTESTTAQELLVTIGNEGIDAESSGATAKIVWSPTNGTAIDAQSEEIIYPLLTDIAALSSVGCITNPFDATVPFGVNCPRAPAGGDDSGAQPTVEQQKELAPALAAAAAANSPISTDGSVATATITFIGGSGDVPSDQAVSILDQVKEANTATMAIGANGQILEYAGQEPPSSEAIGILVAIIILLIAFGSIIAAGMPIIVAIIGLATGQMLVLVVALFLEVPSFTPVLAAMIGLGVGIDYALLVLNRYRQSVLIGDPPKQAAMGAVNTAGRAVLFAGTTVIVALLGLFVLRIGFFDGLALASAVTVLMVMLSALWLLPATLSLLGTKALGLRLPWGTKPGEGKPEGQRWNQYGHLIQRRPWLFAVVSLGLVLVLAIPVFSLRLGFADASGSAPGSPTRIAYDLTAEGFGAGVNGPFIVAVELSSANDLDEYGDVVSALAGRATWECFEPRWLGGSGGCCSRNWPTAGGNGSAPESVARRDRT